MTYDYYCLNKQEYDMHSSSFSERFWAKVDLSNLAQCWNWKAGKRTDGYGVIDGVSAHRASWELHNGPIPRNDEYHGTVVMHKCDNRACVNPSHLFLGTQCDNILDMTRKGRGNPQGGRPMQGTSHPLAKLTDEKVRQIRTEYTGAHGQVSAMARKYNISRRVLLDAAKRRIWKHVD